GLTAEHEREVRLVGETRVECHFGEGDVAALYPFARPFDAKSVDVAGHRTAHVRVKGARQVSRMNSRDASERLVIEAAAEVCADELPRLQGASAVGPRAKRRASGPPRREECARGPGWRSRRSNRRQLTRARACP